MFLMAMRIGTSKTPLVSPIQVTMSSCFPPSSTLGAVYFILGSYEPPLFLCQPLRPSEEVEGKLPEQVIHGILDQSGELGSISVVVKMADAEVLFNYVPDSGDDHVPFFLIGGQL
jgi:hypothetical protein